MNVRSRYGLALSLVAAAAPMLVACGSDGADEEATARAASPLRIEPLDVTERAKVTRHASETSLALSLDVDRGAKLVREGKTGPKVIAVPATSSRACAFATLGENGITDFRVEDPADAEVPASGVRPANYDPGGAGPACNWSSCSYWRGQASYWRGEWLAAVGTFNGSELYYGLQWYEAERAAESACVYCP